MQVPGAIHFGPQHRIHPIWCQRGDYRVVKGAGGMNHPGQRRMAGGYVIQQPRHRGPIGHVTGDHRHRCTGRGQIGDQLCYTRGRVCTPASQHHMLDPIAADEMARQNRCDHPSSTGDQHRARRDRIRYLGGHGQHHFADLAGLADKPVCGRRAARIPGSGRQALQCGCLKQGV